MSKKKPSTNKYSAKNIEILEPREHIRRRPGMYFGGTGKRALHHLIDEVIDNSIESAFVGQCDNIVVRLQADNFVTISDNSSSIPDRLSEEEYHASGMIYLDVVFTQVTGRLYGGYEVSRGLRGLRISAVTAVSSSFDVTVYHDPAQVA